MIDKIASLKDTWWFEDDFLCRYHIAATDVKTRQLRSTGLSVRLLGKLTIMKHLLS